MYLSAILSGLAAALSWGTADFAGGLASRGAAAVRVVLASQFIGTLALLALGAWLREPVPGRSALLWGAVAGLAGGIGLVLLYLSLARGKMGIAAPLTAVASGGIPLFVGLVTQGLPGGPQLAGFVLALAAIWIISRPDGAERMRTGDIALPLLAGVGFGVFLALIGSIEADTGFVWPLVAARVASMTLMSAMVLAGWLVARGGARTAGIGSPAAEDGGTNTSPHPSASARYLLPITVGGGRIAWPLAALAGLGETAGNAFFVYSSQTGRLDVASVLGALYPAATVLLARVVLGERLSARQSLGVGVALAAVLLIAL